MTSQTAQSIDALGGMTAKQLRARYAEVCGEPTRSGNSQWMRRRIAWRLQMLDEGDLAQRALARTQSLAAGIADDADLRVRPRGHWPRRRAHGRSRGRWRGRPTTGSRCPARC